MKKRKNQIEQQVQSSLSKYDNPQFLDELLAIQKNENQQNQSSQNKKKPIKLVPMIVTCSLLIVITISCLSIHFLIPNPSDDKYFSGANQQLESITLEELNDALSEISIENKDIIEIKKCTDTYYNELLFYSISLDSDEYFITTYITIIVNPDYLNTADESFYMSETMINNYKLKYSENYTFEDDVYDYRVYAKIITAGIRIYIDCEYIAFEEGNIFFDYISQIIK